MTWQLLWQVFIHACDFVCVFVCGQLMTGTSAEQRDLLGPLQPSGTNGVGVAFRDSAILKESHYLVAYFRESVWTSNQLVIVPKLVSNYPVIVSTFLSYVSHKLCHVLTLTCHSLYFPTVCLRHATRGRVWNGGRPPSGVQERSSPAISIHSLAARAS